MTAKSNNPNQPGSVPPAADATWLSKLFDRINKRLNLSSCPEDLAAFFEQINQEAEDLKIQEFNEIYLHKYVMFIAPIKNQRLTGIVNKIEHAESGVTFTINRVVLIAGELLETNEVFDNVPLTASFAVFRNKESCINDIKETNRARAKAKAVRQEVEERLKNDQEIERRKEIKKIAEQILVQRAANGEIWAVFDNADVKAVFRQAESIVDGLKSLDPSKQDSENTDTR